MRLMLSALALFSYVLVWEKCMQRESWVECKMLLMCFPFFRDNSSDFVIVQCVQVVALYIHPVLIIVYSRRLSLISVTPTAITRYSFCCYQQNCSEHSYTCLLVNSARHTLGQLQIASLLPIEIYPYLKLNCPPLSKRQALLDHRICIYTYIALVGFPKKLFHIYSPWLRKRFPVVPCH